MLMCAFAKETTDVISLFTACTVPTATDLIFKTPLTQTHVNETARLPVGVWKHVWEVVSGRLDEPDSAARIGVCKRMSWHSFVIAAIDRPVSLSLYWLSTLNTLRELSRYTNHLFRAEAFPFNAARIETFKCFLFLCRTALLSFLLRGRPMFVKSYNLSLPGVFNGFLSKPLAVM